MSGLLLGESKHQLDGICMSGCHCCVCRVWQGWGQASSTKEARQATPEEAGRQWQRAMAREEKEERLAEGAGTAGENAEAQEP